MIDAVDYAKDYVPINDVLASHKGIEMLRTLQGIRPEIAAGIRSQVLRGEMTRAQVKVLLDDAGTAGRVQRNVGQGITLSRIIDHCIDDAPNIGDRIEIQTSTEMDDVAEKIGIDAYNHDVRWDDDQGRPVKSVTHNWALIVSPNIACSRIKGMGSRGFIQAILTAAWSYPILSIYCLSVDEQEQVKRDVSNIASRLEERSSLIYHTTR